MSSAHEADSPPFPVDFTRIHTDGLGGGTPHGRSRGGTPPPVNCTKTQRADSPPPLSISQKLKETVRIRTGGWGNCLPEVVGRPGGGSPSMAGLGAAATQNKAVSLGPPGEETYRADPRAAPMTRRPTRLHAKLLASAAAVTESSGPPGPGRIRPKTINKKDLPYLLRDPAAAGRGCPERKIFRKAQSGTLDKHFRCEITPGFLMHGFWTGRKS